LTTSILPTGTQTITLSYLGNSNFVASSTTVSVSVVSSIFVLDASASGALTVSNSGAINVPGLVLVDSSASNALTVSNSASITAGAVEVVGNVSITGSATVTPAPQTGVASVADPLASLAVPTGGTSQGSVNLKNSQTQTINPGIYTSISVSNSAQLTLNPGVYILAGGNFTVKNSATVTGSGVLIYMAGANYPNSGGSFGTITISNTATVTLTAATTGTYAGIAIFQDRGDTNTIPLQNSAVVNLNGGLLYALKALLSLSNSAQLQHASMVVDQLNIANTGTSTASALSSSALTASLGTSAAPLGSVIPTLLADNRGGERFFAAQFRTQDDDALLALPLFPDPSREGKRDGGWVDGSAAEPAARIADFVPALLDWRVDELILPTLDLF
jgi:hypothetical protein